MKGFLQNRLRESLISESKDRMEYQVRYIDGAVFYKRKKGDDKWVFITDEEFAKNVHDGELVKWDNKEE